jgi:glutamate--cysteine ligase
VSLSTLTDDRRITTIEALVAYLETGCKQPGEMLIGTEHEKFGWNGDTLARPEYTPNGIRELLRRFGEFGWTEILEDEVLVGLQRGRATITIEPGGQLELSGAPFEKVSQTADEFDEHMRELSQITEAWRWSGLGHFPLGHAESAPLMPKPRYKTLEAYVRNVGGDGLHMMRQTCTVQVNLDYLSEVDAMRKLRVGLMVHPMVIALYANSGFVDGMWTDMHSRRAVIWETTAPRRTRLSDVFYRPGATFRDYVDWSLQAPMLFIHRDGAYVDCKGLDFKTFMRSGFNDWVATLGDYALHLSTLFPDVRLKHFLEIRGADMGNREDVLSLPALFKGLFYAPGSLSALDELFDGVTAQESREGAYSAARAGLDGLFRGRLLNDWAQDVLAIAKNGLKALEPDALPYLDALWTNAQIRNQRAQLQTLDARGLLEASELPTL